jgi:hypothetical protein
MPAQAASPPQPELELKYFLPGSHAPFVRRWLDGVVQRERLYPPALVITTYYDTPGLDLLEEKINSDHLKTKVRVRWYSPLDGAPGDGPVFVECKRREGATRDKRRVVARVGSEHLSRLPLSAPDWALLLADLRGDVWGLPPDLAPVMRLAYARHRFVDPRGARISLDTDIAVQAVNPARLHAPARRGSLPHSIFEFKGHGPELPAHLAPVTRFGARRTSFSKYLACYEHVTRQVF